MIFEEKINGMVLFDMIFVVLVYRNDKDLKDFILSIDKSAEYSYKIVVVDAFYNLDASLRIEEVAEKYNADYLMVENKGYSYGNNYGIEYVRSKYDYKYLVVSNPDIIVNKIVLPTMTKEPAAVYGPCIYNMKGKNTNPMYYKKIIVAQRMEYLGFVLNSKILFYSGVLVNKLFRLITKQINKNNNIVRVFQLHGSFIIFSKEVIESLDKVFDEKMFLFAEESYLALRLEEKRIKCFLCSDMNVIHKEDGSMHFRNDIGKQLRDSNIYVFEKYYKFSESKV